MKRGFLVVVSLILVLAVAGCGVKTYTVKKERVDINVSGNQGVIYGPTPAPHRVANPLRDIFNVDVELPTMSEGKKALQREPEQPEQVTQEKGNAEIISQAEPQQAPKAEKIK